MRQGVLQLSVALSALFLPTAALSQSSCPGCGERRIAIPLRDDTGTVRATMYYHSGAVGEGLITFVAPNGTLINQIVPGGPPIGNVLAGPPLEAVTGPDKADGNDRALQRQIDDLRRVLNVVIARLNAAGAH